MNKEFEVQFGISVGIQKREPMVQTWQFQKNLMFPTLTLVR